MSHAAISAALAAQIPSLVAKCILIAIANECDDESFRCVADVSALARKLKAHRRTVQRHIVWLYYRGLLRNDRGYWFVSGDPSTGPQLPVERKTIRAAPTATSAIFTIA